MMCCIEDFGVFYIVIKYWMIYYPHFSQVIGYRPDQASYTIVDI